MLDIKPEYIRTFYRNYDQVIITIYDYIEENGEPIEERLRKLSKEETVFDIVKENLNEKNEVIYEDKFEGYCVGYINYPIYSYDKCSIPELEIHLHKHYQGETQFDGTAIMDRLDGIRLTAASTINDSIE